MAEKSQSAQELIDRIYASRGYVTGYHKLMAESDPGWLEVYDELIQTTYLRNETLDRKTRELLQTVVLSCQRTSTEHIAGHIRVAVQHGATKEEVLAALECVLMPLGALGFGAGLEAWAQVFGVEPVEPSQTS